MYVLLHNAVQYIADIYIYINILYIFTYSVHSINTVHKGTGHRGTGKRVFCPFIDYRKTFDYIDRSLLWA